MISGDRSSGKVYWRIASPENQYETYERYSGIKAKCFGLLSDLEALGWRKFTRWRTLREKAGSPASSLRLLRDAERRGFNTWHERLTFTKNGIVDQKKLAGMGRVLTGDIGYE